MITLNEKIKYISKHNSFVDPINKLDSYIIVDALENEYRPEKPFYATWNITNRCNTQCIYCSNYRSYNSIHELVDEQMLKVPLILGKLGVKYVAILGGEPTFIKSFNAILDSFLKQGIYISFSTNGLNITRETINILSKYSVNNYQVNVSLDSINEQNNNENRGLGSYRNAINAIELLKCIPDIKLSIFSVLTPYTKNDVFKTYQFIKDSNIYGYGIGPVLLTGKANKEHIIHMDEFLINEIYVIMQDAYFCGSPKIRANLGYLEKKQVVNAQCQCTDKISDVLFRRKCNASITRIHVDCNGDVYPCDYLKYPEFFLGNILKDSFNYIWNSPIAIEISKIRRKDKVECKHCTTKSCSTGCMGLSYEKYGTIYRRDPNCTMFVSE